MPYNLVVSKYFFNEIGMELDDSLSDFQEKKNHKLGPKTAKKTKKIKPKHTRGQKDIRSLIKKEESDVLLYSKEFDKVCTEAGVDVDSEDLQLAIALSKSVYDLKKENGSDTENKSTKQLTSHQRTLKIKTTLQEYGFRVPEIKITVKNKRKGSKKLYKLLLLSEKERQQIIADKYSEVLARNIVKSHSENLECDYSDKAIFYKATNIEYKFIKSDNVYCVNELFEKPCYKSCLLRDWSEIPGRPISPILEVENINFDDLVFDQPELDTILSGTISTAQQIVTNKNHVFKHSSITVDNAVKLRFSESKPIDNAVDHTSNVNEHKLHKEITTTDNTSNSNAMLVSHVRCISPDLFDDEVSAVIECPDDNIDFSHTKNENIHTTCMDLTKCVNVNTYNFDFLKKTNLQTNIESDITNRKSNDYMEITECVSNISKEFNVEKIDLTQNYNLLYNKQNDFTCSQNKNVEVMDLTQSRNCDSLAKEINDIKPDLPLDDTIILVEDDINFKLQHHKQNLNKSELPKQICINEFTHDKTDLNSDNNNDQSHQNLSSTFKRHLYDISNKYNCESKTQPLKNTEEVSKFLTESIEYQPDIIDLTQNKSLLQEESISHYATCLGKIDNISIDYDEVNKDIYSTSMITHDCHRYDENSIDEESNKSNKEISSNVNNTVAFELMKGKPSIFSYQAKEDNCDERCTIVIHNKNGLLEKTVCDPNILSHPIVNSEILEISDEEFTYSNHQSKHEYFDFRDVSVFNDNENYENHLGEAGSQNIAVAEENRLINRNNIDRENSPFEAIIQSENCLSTSQPFNRKTPKNSRENIRNELHTPKNSEYIIKTNDVTPMLDYASMSSPERHKELEKYGLKPFKRKRAIQLLTYLYNQTHPVVDYSDDAFPSPSKKQKMNEEDKNCFSKSTCERLDSISKTPVKHVESVLGMGKENDWYAITNEHPNIRNIECDPEDWFFQKKEKSKLHSCRVPLHIALHNYVSCRQCLWEAILRYEPVDIHIIHKDLVATGYRYNPKDLLKFMDRKCITVKTADNNSRNRKS